jgi:hypothetical protein
MILATSVRFICYVAYMFCLQCIALVRNTVKMLLDMLVALVKSIRNAVVALIAVIDCRRHCLLRHLLCQFIRDARNLIARVTP